MYCNILSHNLQSILTGAEVVRRVKEQREEGR